MATATYTKRLYSADLLFLESQSEDPVRVIGTESSFRQGVDPVFYINADAQMEVLPPVREVNINQQLGLIKELLPGGNFAFDEFLPASESLKYWGGEAKVRRTLTDYENAVYGALIREPVVATIGEAKFIQSQPFPLRGSETDSIIFTLQYRIQNNRRGKSRRETPIELHVEIRLGEYTLAESGEWVTDGATISPDTDKFEQTITFKLESQPLPTSGEVVMRIYAPVGETGVPGSVYPIIQQASLQLLIDEVAPPDSFTITRRNTGSYTVVPDTVEALHGDCPDDYANGEFIYENIFTYQSALTRQWQTIGYQEAKPILEHLADTMLRLDGVARQRLSATLMGRLRYWQILQDNTNVVFQRALLPNGQLDPDGGLIDAGARRIFILHGFTHDLKNSAYRVELLELPIRGKVAVTPEPPPVQESVRVRALEDGGLRRTEAGLYRIVEQAEII